MATKADGTQFDPWIQIHHSLIKSPAYRSLKPNSRALLIEVMALYEGYNNGFIGLSYRQAAEAVGIGINQAKAAFDELRAKGFIVMTYKGKRISHAERIASKWEITAFDGFDSAGQPRPATKDYLNWQEAKPVQPDDVKPIEEIDRKQQARKSRSKRAQAIYSGKHIPISSCPSPTSFDPSAEDSLDSYMKQLLEREDEDEDIPF